MNPRLNHAFLLVLLLFVGFACSEDDPGEDMPGPPSIEITSDLADGETGCFGQQVSLEFKLTAPAVIANFTINKNGNQELVNRNDIPVNEFTFSTSYQFDSDDLANGTVTLIAEVKDLDGRSASEEITFNVVAEFAYAIEDINPLPSFDVANNVNVTTETGDSVDIFLRRDIESCGSFCTNYRYTLVSQKATRFYNIPQQPDVTFVNNRFKQADVEAIIAGLTAETELILYSNFPEDLTAMGAQINTPIVVQIRGSGEYAILDADLSDVGAPKLRYRKRTAESGQ